jgi:protein-tyrosine phosphatase
LLVVDGSGVCRGPIVAHTLCAVSAPESSLGAAEVEIRGLEAEAGRTMCESAAARLGYSGSAIAFFGSYRAIPLSVGDIARADLVLTAERAHRSAVVRMLPGTQASVFTWKEALLLAAVLSDRSADAVPPPADLAAVARALHGARGMVPLIEPAVRTGPFHWRRAPDADPLTISSGHRAQADHRRVTQESLDTARALAARLDDVVRPGSRGIPLPERETRGRRLRRTA